MWGPEDDPNVPIIPLHNSARINYYAAGMTSTQFNFFLLHLLVMKKVVLSRLIIVQVEPNK